MMLEKRDCLALHNTELYVRGISMDLIVDLKFGFAPFSCSLPSVRNYKALVGLSSITVDMVNLSLRLKDVWN